VPSHQPGWYACRQSRRPEELAQLLPARSDVGGLERSRSPTSVAGPDGGFGKRRRRRGEYQIGAGLRR
jgi:hypothetical protein